MPERGPGSSTAGPWCAGAASCCWTGGWPPWPGPGVRPAAPGARPGARRASCSPGSPWRSTRPSGSPASTTAWWAWPRPGACCAAPWPSPRRAGVLRPGRRRPVRGGGRRHLPPGQPAHRGAVVRPADAGHGPAPPAASRPRRRRTGPGPSAPSSSAPGGPGCCSARHCASTRGCATRCWASWTMPWKSRGVRIHGVPVLGPTRLLPLLHPGAAGHPGDPGHGRRPGRPDPRTEPAGSRPTGCGSRPCRGSWNWWGTTPGSRKCATSPSRTCSGARRSTWTPAPSAGPGGRGGAHHRRAAAPSAANCAGGWPSFRPSRLVLLGRGENSLWEVERDLRRLFPGQDLAVALCDIRNRGAAAPGVRHLAAPGGVPRRGAQARARTWSRIPRRRIENNIFGTRNVLEAALAGGHPDRGERLHRQGGEPGERAGRVQAHRRAPGDPGRRRRPRGRPLRERALRQRAGQPGQRDPPVPGPDPPGRARSPSPIRTWCATS